MRTAALLILTIGAFAGCGHGAVPPPADRLPSTTRPTTEPAPLEVKITVSQKTAWSFTYPNGKKSNELHVPAGVKGIAYRLTSDDVVHALSVPVLRMKVDAVPKGEATGHFLTNVTVGTYDLVCAEYCGPNHSQCRAKIVVESQEQFDRWLESK